MRPQQEKKQSLFLKKHSSAFTGAFIAALLVLLTMDRFHFQISQSRLLHLENFLKAQSQLDLLKKIPAHRLFTDYHPIQNPEPRAHLNVIDIRLSLFNEFQNQNIPTPAIEKEYKALSTELERAFTPLPRALSDSFVAMNRFIDSRKEFESVEGALYRLVPKLNMEENQIKKIFPSTLFLNLQELDRQTNQRAQHWHQPTSHSPGWFFVEDRRSFSSHFLKNNGEIDLKKAAQYFHNTEISSPFPLWMQRQRPSQEMYEKFDIVAWPPLAKITIFSIIDDVLSKITSLTQMLTQDPQLQLKSISWQLRGLTQLIERTAKLTAPDANSSFVEVMNALNTQLNALGEASNPRWNELAEKLWAYDQKMIQDLKTLEDDTVTKILKTPYSEVLPLWNQHRDTYFSDWPYWVFAKEKTPHKERIKLIFEALKEHGDLALTPEAPWLYWWTEGSIQVYRSHLFFWRQLLLGVAIGMTLILWTLKKVFSS